MGFICPWPAWTRNEIGGDVDEETYTDQDFDWERLDLEKLAFALNHLQCDYLELSAFIKPESSIWGGDGSATN